MLPMQQIRPFLFLKFSYLWPFESLVWGEFPHISISLVDHVKYSSENQFIDGNHDQVVTNGFRFAYDICW